MKESLNIPPFTPGQKVVCIDNATSTKGNVIKKNTVYTVDRCEFRRDLFIKSNNCIAGWMVKLNGMNTLWLCSDFVPESKFRAVSFEKVMEETEKICEN